MGADGWDRKIKMSVFSRFAQKFAEVAVKSRQFSTTVKRKGIWGLDFSKIHEPWHTTMNIQASQWNKWKFWDITLFWLTFWATPFWQLQLTMQFLLDQPHWNPY